MTYYVYNGALNKCLTATLRSMPRCYQCGKPFKNDAPVFVRAEELFMNSQGVRYCGRCVRNMAASFPRMFQHEVNPYWSKLLMEGKGRTIGIEIECNPSLASMVRLVDCKFIAMKPDNSLRGRSCEIVSPVLRETSYSRWLDMLDPVLKATVYSRCGLHIWVGARDYGWWDAYNLLKYCSLWQNEFASIVSPSRRASMMNGKNNSGLPMVLPPVPDIRTKAGWLYWLYGTNMLRHGRGRSMMENSKRANDNGGHHYTGVICRYWWLNIHGLYHRDAVEIRLHQGTTNPEKISNWIKLWVQIMDNIYLYGHKVMKISPLKLVSHDLRDYYTMRSKQLSQIDQRKVRF
jgi:hypothetical protein